MTKGKIIVMDFLIEDIPVMAEEATSEEWLKLTEKLGIQAQKEIISTKAGVIPYPKFKEHEKAVFYSILNRQTDYKTFKSEIIPLRVLQSISLCEIEGYFKKIEIWSSREDEEMGYPLQFLVVGVDKINSYDREYYKIAQWGEKIQDAGELIDWYKIKEEDSARQYLKSTLEKLEKDVIKYRSQVNNLNSNANASKNPQSNI
jgi:hypothetical protein